MWQAHASPNLTVISEPENVDSTPDGDSEAA
jgi:hypothetical protein